MPPAKPGRCGADREPRPSDEGAKANRRARSRGGDDPIADDPAGDHQQRKGRVGGDGEAGRHTRAREIGSAPVADRAFGRHRYERERRRAARGAGWAPQTTGAAETAALARQKGSRDGDDQRREQSGPQEPPKRSELTEPPAQHCARRAAQAESGVKRGHDRPAPAAFDVARIGVHRDVHAPCVAPATKRRRAQRSPATRRNQSRQERRRIKTADDRRRSTPQTVGEKTHERHRNDRAGGESQKRQAKRCIGKREVRLDPRDSGCPGAHSGAIRHEGAERRQAPRPGRRHNPVRGKLETCVGHLGLSGMHERTAETAGVTAGG